MVFKKQVPIVRITTKLHCLINHFQEIFPTEDGDGFTEVDIGRDVKNK